VPVDLLRDRRASVADEVGDLLQRHPAVRHDRYDAVAQFPG
jgi:hypothetical protein